jgi:hypothetical protein
MTPCTRYDSADTTLGLCAGESATAASGQPGRAAQRARTRIDVLHARAQLRAERRCGARSHSAAA